MTGIGEFFGQARFEFWSKFVPGAATGAALAALNPGHFTAFQTGSLAAQTIGTAASVGMMLAGALGFGLVLSSSGGLVLDAILPREDSSDGSRWRRYADVLHAKGVPMTVRVASQQAYIECLGGLWAGLLLALVITLGSPGGLSGPLVALMALGIAGLPMVRGAAIAAWEEMVDHSHSALEGQLPAGTSSSDGTDQQG